MEERIFRFQKYGDLYERLAAYAKSDYYPFHMPGHKRSELNFVNPYKIDLTEIDGFDNLHHAEEILLKSQKRLEKIYHSKKSYYLINGSTCGLLSAIGALVKADDRILIARNCHKSVYNAVKLFRLNAEYVHPEIMKYGIQGKINPEQIEDSFKKYQDTKLVVITSPTYDGIVSDIRKIADIVHKYHAYLIIDEAHGAHFSMSSYFPESAIGQGADIVVHSLHKTLPSFTQTAALHVVSDSVDCTKLEEMLGVFESSSPSYLLMAGIDRCVGMMERSGKHLFDQYQEKLSRFYAACEKLKHLHILTEKDYKEYNVAAIDHGKIIIHTDDVWIDGVKLYDLLLERYHLQMEMYSAQYVLAMTSIMDTQEGFDRLFWALLEIDRELDDKQYPAENMKAYDIEKFSEEVYAVREKVMEISDAADYNIEETRLEQCAGKICAEYIYLYPPGIPMIVPGEKISESLIQVLKTCRQMGLQVQGTKDRQYRKILTVAYDTDDQL